MTIRSFIAVDPSPEVSGRIGDLIRRLSKETKGFKWVDPNAVHLTLRFLGDVEEGVLGVISEKLRDLSSQTFSISLAARGIGFFPSPQSPRVVWVGLEGETDRLLDLQSKIETLLDGLDVHREEKKPFTPHLTLARARDPRSMVGVARILQTPDVGFGEFVIRSVILYKSRLTPHGAEYSKLGEFNLKE